jgi:hypothetical protein
MVFQHRDPVEKVGHERANATAEVRRSLNGSHPSSYQAGYMLVALLLRALHAELRAGLTTGPSMMR